MTRNSGLGSRPSFSAISSMAISSATGPAPRPGARIAFAFRKVEHGEPIRRHAIRTRIQESRLAAAVSGLPPGRSPDQKSRALVSPLAVMRMVYLPVGAAGPRCGCAAHMIIPGNTVAPS